MYNFSVLARGKCIKVITAHGNTNYRVRAFLGVDLINNKNIVVGLEEINKEQALLVYPIKDNKKLIFSWQVLEFLDRCLSNRKDTMKKIPGYLVRDCWSKVLSSEEKTLPFTDFQLKSVLNIVWRNRFHIDMEEIDEYLKLIGDSGSLKDESVLILAEKIKCRESKNWVGKMIDKIKELI